MKGPHLSGKLAVPPSGQLPPLLCKCYHKDIFSKPAQIKISDIQKYNAEKLQSPPTARTVTTGALWA